MKLDEEFKKQLIFNKRIEQYGTQDEKAIIISCQYGDIYRQIVFAYYEEETSQEAIERRDQEAMNIIAMNIQKVLKSKQG